MSLNRSSIDLGEGVVVVTAISVGRHKVFVAFFRQFVAVVVLIRLDFFN